MSNVKIISDGLASGTRVEVDGVRMDGVTRIEILPITKHSDIKAKLTLEFVNIEMLCEVEEKNWLRIAQELEVENENIRQAVENGIEAMEWSYQNYSSCGDQQSAYRIRSRINLLKKALEK